MCYFYVIEQPDLKLPEINVLRGFIKSYLIFNLLLKTVKSTKDLLNSLIPALISFTLTKPLFWLYLGR